jgi:hypothetical protein
MAKESEAGTEEIRKPRFWRLLPDYRAYGSMCLRLRLMEKEDEVVEILLAVVVVFNRIMIMMHTRAFFVQSGPEQLNFLGEGSKVTQVLFRPADIFSLFLLGPARPVALLSAKALKYNPERCGARSD